MQTTERERQTIYREAFERHRRNDEEALFYEEWVALHVKPRTSNTVGFLGIVAVIVFLGWALF